MNDVGDSLSEYGSTRQIIEDNRITEREFTTLYISQHVHFFRHIRFLIRGKEF